LKNWHTTFVVGIVVAIVVALLLFRGSPAAAPEEDYPTRTINLYIGSPPGGSLDLSGRVLAERLVSTLGEQVVIVNKPG